MLVMNRKLHTRHLFPSCQCECTIHLTAAPFLFASPLGDGRWLPALEQSCMLAGMFEIAALLRTVGWAGWGGARGGTLGALPFTVISLGANNRRTQCCYQSQATMCIPPGLMWGGFPSIQQLIKGINHTLITFPLHIIWCCMTYGLSNAMERWEEGVGRLGLDILGCSHFALYNHNQDCCSRKTISDGDMWSWTVNRYW